MILQVDCEGALDFMIGWNVSGLTKHVSVQACFLHKLKEANQISCIWIPTNLNLVDIYTNVASGQSDPAVAVGTQVLPIQTDVYDSESGESGVLLKGSRITEVCYLLEVSWQMCHAWITHWTVARAILTMSRRRSTHDERTHGRDARKPLLART